MVEFPRSSHVEAHDHALCLVSDDAPLERWLAPFLREGLARGHLCVFLHSFDDDAEAWDLVERLEPEAASAPGERGVVVLSRTDAFEEDGALDIAKTARSVAALVEDARRRGRSGVRIFADASRAYIEEGRESEWFELEEGLGRRLGPAVALVCAYLREHVLRPDLFPRVLRTHAYRFDPPPALPHEADAAT